MTGKRLTAEQYEARRKLWAACYEQGMSIREIAAKYNKGYGTIYYGLSDAGVTFRPRGGGYRKRRKQK